MDIYFKSLVLIFKRFIYFAYWTNSKKRTRILLMRSVFLYFY